MKAPFLLNVKTKLISLESPKIMGILNITPDSFYENSRVKIESVLQKASQMLADGADFIDIGGASTNPFVANPVSAQEESDRVLPIIEILTKNIPKILISIDTFHASVARQAIEAGSVMINDVSGGNLDPEMFKTVAELNVPYILMHSRGTFQTMTQLTDYKNVTLDVIADLKQKIMQLRELGVKDIIVDAGFGFAKNLDQNYELINHLDRFEILNCPVLVGISRKSMIWKALSITPEKALNGTSVLNTIALMKGANILRVHDVKEAKETIDLTKRCLNFDV